MKWFLALALSLGILFPCTLALAADPVRTAIRQGNWILGGLPDYDSPTNYAVTLDAGGVIFIENFSGPITFLSLEGRNDGAWSSGGPSWYIRLKSGYEESTARIHWSEGRMGTGTLSSWSQIWFESHVIQAAIDRTVSQKRWNPSTVSITGLSFRYDASGYGRIVVDNLQVNNLRFTKPGPATSY